VIIAGKASKTDLHRETLRSCLRVINTAETLEQALTQHSRHQPQSSGPDFVEVPEGEEKVVGTGRSSPESASNHGRFRSAQRTDEIARRLQTTRKCHTDKPFGYFAVHDTVVGFTPGWLPQDLERFAARKRPAPPRSLGPRPGDAAAG